MICVRRQILNEKALTVSDDMKHQKMLSNGVDESTIKNQHGHTDIKTTKGYYQFDIQQKAERKKQIEQAINY